MATMSRSWFSFMVPIPLAYRPGDSAIAGKRPPRSSRAVLQSPAIPLTRHTGLMCEQSRVLNQSSHEPKENQMTTMMETRRSLRAMMAGAPARGDLGVARRGRCGEPGSHEPGASRCRHAGVQGRPDLAQATTQQLAHRAGGRRGGRWPQQHLGAAAAAHADGRRSRRRPGAAAFGLLRAGAGGAGVHAGRRSDQLVGRPRYGLRLAGQRNTASGSTATTMSGSAATRRTTGRSSSSRRAAAS